MQLHWSSMKNRHKISFYEENKSEPINEIDYSKRKHVTDNPLIRNGCDRIVADQNITESDRTSIFFYFSVPINDKSSLHRLRLIDIFHSISINVGVSVKELVRFTLVWSICYIFNVISFSNQRILDHPVCLRFTSRHKWFSLALTFSLSSIGFFSRKFALQFSLKKIIIFK